MKEINSIKRMSILPVLREHLSVGDHGWQGELQVAEEADTDDAAAARVRRIIRGHIVIVVWYSYL